MPRETVVLLVEMSPVAHDLVEFLVPRDQRLGGPQLLLVLNRPAAQILAEPSGLGAYLPVVG